MVFWRKKYSEEDLVLFEQNEPKILIDDTVVSRSEFRVIQLSNINDLIEQMEYKKGTIAYDYLKKKIDTVEMMEQLENINDHLDRISLLLNQNLNLQLDGINYHTEAKYFNADQLIQKIFCPILDKTIKIYPLNLLTIRQSFYYFFRCWK